MGFHLRCSSVIVSQESGLCRTKLDPMLIIINLIAVVTAYLPLPHFHPGVGM